MTILHLLFSPVIGAVIGYLFFRWAARRSMVADAPDSYAWESAYRSVSVHRNTARTKRAVNSGCAL